MRKLIFALLSSVMFIGCVNHTTNNSLLDISGLNEETFDKSNKEIYAVAMETTNESIIRSYDKIVVSDSAIVILDEEQMKVFIFDHSGKSLSVIDKRGRSAKEYTSIGDIDIFEDKLYILDYGQRKILVANYNGDITDVIKYHNYYGMRFFVDGNGFTLFNHGENTALNNSQIVTLNMEGELINTYLPRDDDQVFSISPSGYFAKNSRANYFIPIYSDKLYTIEEGEPQIVYDFKLGKMIENNSVDRTDIKSTRFGYFFNLLVTDDLTFVCANHESGESYYLFCNSKSGDIRLSNDVIIRGAYRDYFIILVTSLSKYPAIGEVNYPVDEYNNAALVFIPTAAIIYNKY